MFTLASKLLTQQDSRQIMDNLSATEDQLQDLNQEWDIVRGEYLQLIDDYNATSFFNIDNIYFWFLIAGMLLLLFGLLYLLAELKREQVKEKKYSHWQPKNNIVPIRISSVLGESLKVSVNKKIKKSEHRLSNLSNLSQNIDQSKFSQSTQSSVKKKPVKIKVIKVK